MALRGSDKQVGLSRNTDGLDLEPVIAKRQIRRQWDRSGLPLCRDLATMLPAAFEPAVPGNFQTARGQPYRQLWMRILSMNQMHAREPQRHLSFTLFQLMTSFPGVGR
jgi:hypothetical protein